MLTAQDTIDRVLSRLGPGASRFWDVELDLIPAYNDALDEISDETGFWERNVTVPRRKWSTYTDLRGVLPEEPLQITAVWSPNTQRFLQTTNVRELDASLGRGWERNTDLPRAWFMRGLWWLGIYPRPADDTSPVRVYYKGRAPHLTSDGGLGFGLTQSPGLPPDFEPAIEEYMLYALCAGDTESKQSMDSGQSFEGMMMELKAAVGQRMHRDRTPRMGARR